MANVSTSLVSIGMPVLNVERTLGAALRSLIGQTWQNWELLVIDDGSEDATLQVMKQFNDSRIRFVSDGRHKGLPARLNETIDLSRGAYYARMDGDDIAYPDRLKRQITFIQEHPQMDLIGAWVMVFGEGGIPLGKRAGPRISLHDSKLMRNIGIAHPTFFGKTEWFKQHRYATWPLHFQDQHLLMKTFRTSQFGLVPEILLGYREERLTVEKQLRYRWSYVKSFRGLSGDLGVARALALIAIQILKLGVDAFAIGTGLKYRILRHRAEPITHEELQTWQQIWKMVN